MFALALTASLVHRTMMQLLPYRQGSLQAALLQHMLRDMAAPLVYHATVHLHAPCSWHHFLHALIVVTGSGSFNLHLNRRNAINVGCQIKCAFLQDHAVYSCWWVFVLSEAAGRWPEHWVWQLQ
jgi:hypothetical protein